MTESINKAIWDRAKEIFDREKPDDETWGTATHDGKQVYSFQERESPNSPAITIIGEERRKAYLERARQELTEEGLI